MRRESAAAPGAIPRLCRGLPAAFEQGETVQEVVRLRLLELVDRRGVGDRQESRRTDRQNDPAERPLAGKTLGRELDEERDARIAGDAGELRPEDVTAELAQRLERSVAGGLQDLPH